MSLFHLPQAAESPPAINTSPCDPAINSAIAGQGLWRLIEQYKGKPRLAHLIRGFLTEVQAVENALIGVFESRDVATATDAQLDVIGRILGLRRGDWSEESYRTFLALQLRLLRSSGTGPELVEMLSLLLSSFALKEYTPCAFEVYVDNIEVSETVIYDVLSRAKSGGVRCDLATGATDAPFSFSLSAAVEADSVYGFADTDELTGGEFLGVYVP